MSEISEAAKAKACELINAARPEGLPPCRIEDLDFEGRWSGAAIAFALYIQEVSDAAKKVLNACTAMHDAETLAPFILPDQDPLKAAMMQANAVLKGEGCGTYDEALDAMRDLMHALEIRETSK